MSVGVGVGVVYSGIKWKFDKNCLSFGGAFYYKLHRGSLFCPWNWQCHICHFPHTQSCLHWSQRLGLIIRI